MLSFACLGWAVDPKAYKGLDGIYYITRAVGRALVGLIMAGLVWAAYALWAAMYIVN